MEACWAHNPEVRGSKPRSAKHFRIHQIHYDVQIENLNNPNDGCAKDWYKTCCDGQDTYWVTNPDLQNYGFEPSPRRPCLNPGEFHKECAVAMTIQN